MSTGLEGQFRVLHPMKDTKGVLAYFGNFGKGQLYAAKRYKKDPGGGYDQVEGGREGRREGRGRERESSQTAPRNPMA